MKNSLKIFPQPSTELMRNSDRVGLAEIILEYEVWKADLEAELRTRLETLEEDAINYVGCEFNASKFREGLIQQIKLVLGVPIE